MESLSLSSEKTEFLSVVFDTEILTLNAFIAILSGHTGWKL